MFPEFEIIIKISFLSLLLENSKSLICLCLSLTYSEASIKLANTHNFHNVVETLCHEMVHVKQFLRKELNATGMLWKGQPNPNTGNPLEEPHEVEAYELEKVLYQKCVDLKLV